MNRLGRQFLGWAHKAGQTNWHHCAPNRSLYSAVKINPGGFKCIPILQAHSRICSNQVVYGLSRRFQHVSVNEDGRIEEEEESGDISAAGAATDEQVAEFLRQNQIFVKGLQDPKIQKPYLDFGQIQLPEKLQSLMERQKLTTPTPIQAMSLPILLSGRDLIGIAQTGSGKTLAFLLPALQKYFAIHRDYFSYNREEEYHESKLSRANKRLNPKVLILAPTRELACQIYEVVRAFRIFKTICLYGGSDRNRQVQFLNSQSPLIVVSTPGRLKDLLASNCLSLEDVEYLVVDEADRMLDMGFEPQISFLIKQCSPKRQTMMFSASWPDEVKSLVHRYLQPNHAFLSIGGTKLVANHNIQQTVDVCTHFDRIDKLGEILKKHEGERVLIFANTKMQCQRVAGMIHGKLRIRAAAMHGDLSQRQREQTLLGFKSDHIKVLVATNVAARGLDVDNVSVVVNYDLPDDIETYVHRIGRTGRKQNKGHAYSFFIDHDKNALARSMIEIMRESNNEVPAELEEIASQRNAPRQRQRNSYRGNDYQSRDEYGGNYGGNRGGPRRFDQGRPRKYDNDFYN